MSGTNGPSMPQAEVLTHTTGSMTSMWLTGLVSFVIVIALILLCRYGLKYLEPYLLRTRRTRHLAVLETLSLDQRRRISLIRCGDHEGVILTGGGSDIFLGWIPPHTPGTPSASPAPDSFAQAVWLEERREPVEPAP